MTHVLGRYLPRIHDLDMRRKVGDWFTCHVSCILIVTFNFLYLARLCYAFRLVFDASSTSKIFLSDGREPLQIQCPRLLMNTEALMLAKAHHIFNNNLSRVDDKDAIQSMNDNGFYIPVRKYDDEWYVSLNRGFTSLG